MLPPEFWEQEKARLLEILLPYLEETVAAGLSAGADKLRGLGIDFDNRLVNTSAAAWARQHAGNLVELLTNTSRERVREAVAAWIETPGSTVGQLTDQLMPLVEQNADRALMIATTETTSAYANGEALVYAGAGLPRAVFLPPGHPRCRCWTNARRLPHTGEWVILWQTNRDEIVCTTPIQTPWGRVAGCRQLHNTVISEGPYLGRKVTDLG